MASGTLQPRARQQDIRVVERVGANLLKPKVEATPQLEAKETLKGLLQALRQGDNLLQKEEGGSRILL